ncbi:Leucine zipper-EF-hand-containing transmembrane protein 1 [Citrus sinensis]|nr:Leucine zipper-EF-hand-containing transmembrane protein 1 [Citrus sinensis]
MTSRAILRRKNFLFNYLNRPTYLTRGLPSFEYGHTTASNYFERSSLVGFSIHSSEDTDGGQEGGLSRVTKDELSKPLPVGFLKHDFFQMSNFKYGVGRVSFISPLQASLISQSVRYGSTATAGQPERDRNEQLATKQIKEASPEDCDQAVEGLSTVKAKATAKAKQMQDIQKSAKSVVQRVWAALLGIGPALRAVASMSREDWAVKLRHWKDEFKSTMQHYWLGTKLLWADIRISSRLLLKLVNGKGLSRRERQQLTRTTADIFRLVPVAVFIIVPFMEFLLPVFLKLFPNMLPSTFQDKMREEEALKRRLIARIEYAKFLQDTVKEMAKEVQNSRGGDIKKTAEDLDEFMNKVRTGAGVSNDEILAFAKLFNDELTLDNISRIKNDDKMIQAEGVESLSEAELRQACRDRGLLGLLSVEEMRQQLRDWLDLSLNHSVPSSLLILSRAFSVSGKVRPEEAVQATLSSLPDEVVDTVGVTALPSEDSISERRRKLEFLEMQEELIKPFLLDIGNVALVAEAVHEVSFSREESTLHPSQLVIKEEEEEEEEEQAKMKEAVRSRKDVALEEMTDPTAKEAQEQAKAKTLEKHEQLCELSRALAVLASASSVSREREEFLRLVNKEIELYNSMVEKDGKVGEEEAKKAYRAAREETDQDAGEDVDEKVDAMLQKLEKEIDDVDAKIGDRWRLLDRDYDGKVTAEEVASAAMYLKDTLDKEGIQELIANLSKDREGKILVEDIVKLASQTEDTETAETGRS